MMHTGQMLAGSAAIAAVASLMANPFWVQPPPIEVHYLKFDGANIIQSRTVEGEGEKFFAKWQAQIEDAQTGEIVCEGSGSWNYAVGTIDVEMDLPRWVGQEDCTFEALPSGRYVPVATWYWGSDQTSHKGQVFEK